MNYGTLPKQPITIGMSLILVAFLIPLVSAWTEHQNKYLSGYTSSTSIYPSLSAAQQACSQKTDCGGVTYEPNNKRYTTRKGIKLLNSLSGETSWLKLSVSSTNKNSDVLTKEYDWIANYDKYLFEYTSPNYIFPTLLSAQQVCSQKTDCGGITYEPEQVRYTTRKGLDLRPSSSSEISWLNPKVSIPGWISFYGKYLSGYTSTPFIFTSLIAAEQACSEKRECGGVTYEPFNDRYTTRKVAKLIESPSGEISWLNPASSLFGWTSHDGKYLLGYTKTPFAFASLIAAQVACSKKSVCGGITYEYSNDRYTTRTSTDLKSSSTGETSWLNPDASIFGWNSYNDKYLTGYTSVPFVFPSKISAQLACSEKPDCAGVTYEPENKRYTTRKDKQLKASQSGEMSWLNPRRLSYQSSSDILSTGLGWIAREGMYLSGYASPNYIFSSVIAAQKACSEKNDCGGVTYEPLRSRYTTRKGTQLKSSPSGEVTWLNPQASLQGWNSYNDKYLSGYTSSQFSSESLLAAQKACSKIVDCGGVTYEPASSRYTTRNGTELQPSTSEEISWLNPDASMQGWTFYNGKYLSGYTSQPNSFESLIAAQRACSKKPDCGGVTKGLLDGRQYTTRNGIELKDSSLGEVTWFNPDASLPNWSTHPGKYLAEYVTPPYVFGSLIAAQNSCNQRNECYGVTKESAVRFTLREGNELKASVSNEISYTRG